MSEHTILDRIYPVSRETKQRLELYVASLRKWQAKTNLIAPSTLDTIWERHIADSLRCVAIRPDARQWLDLGSGGGFPGLVIAAAMQEHKDGRVTMVESNRKKAAFLRQTNREMNACGEVFATRIEAFDGPEVFPQVVTARALAALPLLLKLSQPWLGAGASGLFHKGREYAQELEDCDGLWEFDLVSHESGIEQDSIILEIKNLKPVRA